jgi:hypothetical protein
VKVDPSLNADAHRAGLRPRGGRRSACYVGLRPRPAGGHEWSALAVFELDPGGRLNFAVGTCAPCVFRPKVHHRRVPGD